MKKWWKNLRESIWRKMISKHPEGQVFPKRIILLYCVLFPLKGIAHKVGEECYDHSSDTWTIYGTKYSGTLFRCWAEDGILLSKYYTTFKREDGVVTLKTIDINEIEKSLMDAIANEFDKSAKIITNELKNSIK